MRTIKEVRLELRTWGNFWARQEAGQGWPSKSPTERLRESCQVGCAASSDLHLFSGNSESMNVPDHISAICASVEQLENKHKSAIRQKYVSKKGIGEFSNHKTFMFWLRNAEKALL